MGLEVTFLGALLAGLLSFVSPCVLPLVPPYLCFLAGTSITELSDENMPAAAWRKVVMSAIAFVAGFATVFVAMGASGAERWVKVLRPELTNPDQDLQIEAIHAAGDLGLDNLGKDLWELTFDDDHEIALSAIWALGQTGWDGAFERLDELTLHADQEISDCADEAMEEWLFYNGLSPDHDDDDMDLFLEE